MGVSFLCVCPPKTIRFDDSKDTSQAQISARLDAADSFHGQATGQLRLPGAGAVYTLASDLSVATEETCFAIFKGQLDNYPYLVRKYCSSRLQQDRTLTLNQIKQAAPLTDAEVICELYQTLGTAFLTKLKGDFTFVCYDSRKVRVLAARGASGKFDLWQARASDACLCVGSGNCMPQDCQNKLEIQPGHFKYGWYADPQRFAAALPDSTTNAAATAAQKAMEGIMIAPARSSPLDVRRYSSSSGADMSSQSWYPSRSPSRSTSTALTAPITISGKEVSTGSLGASSMYSETVDESVMSDSSMMTTRTNKTRRGKRGGKKQRENSQLRKQQPLPPSPTMASSPSGSQADQRGWWRSSRSDASFAQRNRVKQGLAAQDSADDASDVASAMSLGDVPKGAYTPPSLHGSADAAWGQDAEEASDADADTLMPLLSTSMKGPLPTVMEHFDEGIGMSRPQSLADLSKAGWTVDNALLQASANANISRMSRISSFPCLPTMVETVTDSTGGSPPPPWGFPAAPQGPVDTDKPWGSAWDGLAPEPRQASTDAAQPSSLNPNAFSFQPGLLSTQLHHSTATAPAVAHDTAEQRRKLRDMLASNVPSPAAAVQSQDAAAISPQLKPIVTSIGPDKHGASTVDPADGFAQALEVRQKSVSIAELARQADKSVARRLLLKKRVPSFGKSKSCNDLAAAVPKSPTRSPLAPLGNFGQ